MLVIYLLENIYSNFQGFIKGKKAQLYVLTAVFMPPDCNAVKSVIHAADSFQFLLPKTKQDIIHVVYCSSVKSGIWIQVSVCNKVRHELSLRASQLPRAHCICPNMLLMLLP